MGGVSIPRLKVLARPDLVVPAPVVEVQRRTRAAVLDDASDGLPIGMAEMVAVSRNDVPWAIEELKELRAHVVLACVMRDLERIDLQPRAVPGPQQLADRLNEDRCMRVGREQRTGA